MKLLAYLLSIMMFIAVIVGFVKSNQVNYDFLILSVLFKIYCDMPD